MNKSISIFCFYLLIIVFSLLVFSAPIIATQVEPFPDKAAPGYHPGLFTHTSSKQDLIPPVVNIFESSKNEFSYIPPVISYSHFPGNGDSGELPSIAGFVSGTIINTAVNISGRKDNAEPVQYLVTIVPNEQGIFVWQIPDWASEYTEFIVEIAHGQIV